jgi:hypothetical protein
MRKTGKREREGGHWMLESQEEKDEILCLVLLSEDFPLKKRLKMKKKRRAGGKRLARKGRALAIPALASVG